jgi:acetyl-CoA C-acetyltransferase/acetyl-CoA acyltransferase 2
MAKLSKSIVIVGAKRTAFGTLQGTLKGISANDLAVHAAKAALAQSGVAADAIRHVGLKAGLPNTTPALTVNRLCGSGFQAVINGAEQLLLGETDAVLVGGTENMTQAPHVLRGGRDGWAFGKAPQVGDSLWDALTDSYCQTPMAITAENLAQKYGITREMCDELALSSQKRWAAANEKGLFKDEIAPIDIVTKKATVAFAQDEHPRPTTTPEILAKLGTAFKKDGVVTAGNASGINDGAACLVLTTEEFAKANGLKPLARLVQWGVAGVEPSLMGIGPVPAIKNALSRAGLELKDMDLVEVNEAFAAQYLAVEKELGLDRAKTNVNGGAIAIGHPLGASGARITAHLVYELARRGARYGVGSACIGGGQGLAVVLERV